MIEKSIDLDIDVGRELTRKAMEVLENLILRHGRHEISSEALKLALESINAATLGLVENELSRAIELEALKLESVPEFCILKSGGFGVTMWASDDGVTRHSGSIQVSKRGAANKKEALAALNRKIETLESSGFERVV